MALTSLSYLRRGLTIKKSAGQSLSRMSRARAFLAQLAPIAMFVPSAGYAKQGVTAADLHLLAVVVLTLTAMVCVLISGVLKISLMKRFKLDKAWFEYGSRQALAEAKQPSCQGVPRLLRRAYALFNYLSLGAMAGAVLFFALKLIQRGI